MLFPFLQVCNLATKTNELINYIILKQKCSFVVKKEEGPNGPNPLATPRKTRGAWALLN